MSSCLDTISNGPQMRQIGPKASPNGSNLDPLGML